MNSFCFCVALCLDVIAAPPGEPTGKPWLDMDYGPFLSASIEAPFPEKNIACKGIAVRLQTADGEKSAAILFDTDLLRYAAGWTNGFVELKGVVYDGEHWAYPRIDGRQLFGTRVGPGWAQTGSFVDPRALPYGPLPRGWARWKGLYKSGDRVVFAYSVGAARVLELPGVEHDGDTVALSRCLEIDPTGETLLLEVFFAGQPLEISSDGAWIASTGARTTAATVVGNRDGVRWSVTPDGHARLQIESSPSSRRLKLLVFGGREEDRDAFRRIASASGPPSELGPLTVGGKSCWKERVHTHGTLGSNAGPYAIDSLTPPDQNPWRSWMRFGGIDWLDPTRAALSTWSGDVWIVSGIGPTLERLEWRRIAAGLYQPLGLRVRDGEIFVVGRDQITRLRDLDGDGETDFYECFNNDAQNTEHFHEFAMDLETDADGNFYYMKGARHARDSVVPQHGTLLKVSRDGLSTEILSNGFRAPNGLYVSPTGDFLSTDQQGHWIPANRINLLHPGSFGGNMWSYHRGAKPTTYDPPLCWIHPSVDRSPSTILRVDSEKWGPFSGDFLSISYGMGQLFVVPFERVSGVAQGGVVKLPLELDTGICRGRFHPVDGQLYTCGLFGWAGNKTRPGAFYRIRYTGKPVNVPHAFHAAEGELDVVFTDSLDAVEARNPGNYGVQCWNYRWTENYGSPDIRFDGREGRETIAVAAAELGADGKTVRLSLPGLRPVMQLNVDFNLKSSSGEPIRAALHATIHALGRSEKPVEPSQLQTAALALQLEAQGLVQSLQGPLRTARVSSDSRVARLIALYVPDGEPPTPFIKPGAFRSEWRGFLKLEINDTYVFEASGRGLVRLDIGGKTVLNDEGESLGSKRSGRIELAQGLTEIRLTYQSPASGDAWMRLYWQRGDSALEPIPPTALVHDAADPKLLASDRLRRGRELFAERRCVRCHAPGSPLEKGAMPELRADAPLLVGAESRLDSGWISRWLLDPRAVRPDARMPGLITGSPAERARDARDLAAFLSTQIDANPPATTPPSISTKDPPSGAALWNSLGCFACHTLPREARKEADSRIALDHVGEKWLPGQLVEYLQSPGKYFEWTRMPDFKLSAPEAKALAGHLLKSLPAKPSTGVGLDARGDSVRGRELTRSLRCTACHEIPGIERPENLPRLESLALSDRGCLAASAELGGAPDFAFSDEERIALRTFLKEGLASLAGEDASELAERQMRALRCMACHERDGSGDPWLELSGTPATEVDPTEPGTVHRSRPPITWAGEKLRPEWTNELLSGVLGYRARPRASARMPSFRVYASEISKGLALQHGFPPSSPERGRWDRELAGIGRSLTQPTAFVCVQCHPVAGQRALAGPDTETIDFCRVSDRLTEHYFRRFMKDPGSLLSSTMMPRYTTSDGKSVIKNVFEGDASRQFEAIWQYLRSIETNR